MDKLEKLFSDETFSTSACEGCSILEKNKPIHCHLDFESLGTSDILFLSDSLKYKYGKTFAFSDIEIDKVIEPACAFMPEGSYQMAAAVKCPDVREADMNPNNMVICRSYLNDTINKVKPRLVFVCGNLSMKMLIKKSGITNKRGKSFDYESESGHKCIVVPIYHPYSVIKEPSNRVLLEMDIKNAYDMYIADKKVEKTFSYKLVTKFSELEEYDYFSTTDYPVACDIETTGLNFLKDQIMTVALSCNDKTVVIPIDHKDTPFSNSEKFALLKWISCIMQNTENKKVFHNSKFDQKFLLRYGVRCVNVWDTKIMSHLVNENMPKSLMDLVKAYFPMELDSL